MSTPDSPTPDDSLAMDSQNFPKSPAPAPDPDPATTAGHDDRPLGDGGTLFGGGPFDDSADEEALRTLMLEAVSGLHGSPDALDHLRKAIPLRRQRRRQALVGAAAAVLLVGMAVPALLRATGSEHNASTTAAGVSASHTGSPGEDGHTSAWGDSGGTAGTVSPGPGDGTKQQPSTAGGTNGPSNATAPTPSVPECSPSQLGNGTSKADAPDSGGRVYGWFRLANVSDSPCTVPSGGIVKVVAQGAADPARIQVVGHTQGDAAAGLPSDPSTGPVVLGPGQRYEVAFAWVPDGDGPGGCPTTPTTPPTTPTTPPTTPTPTATPTDTTGADPGGTDPGTVGNAASPQLGEDAPASPPPGSVTLNHTPATGSPVIDGPVIPDACAGTIYTTSAIPEAPATPAP